MKSEEIINIVDAPCGKGKTSWAIQYMNKNIDKQFLFVTPFLDQVERIRKACPSRSFKAPEDDNKSKLSHLKDLFEREQNIVATHKLFSMLDEEALELLRMSKYTLILDEVMDVIHVEQIASHDLQMLQAKGWIEIDTDTGKVTAPVRQECYKGSFSDIIEKASTGRLVCCNETFILWQYPPEIFDVFEGVFILTYLFQGQQQRAYFEYHDRQYQMHSVEGSFPDGYTLSEYDPVEGDRELRERLKTDIRIYDGNLNNVGDSGLSYSWHNRYAKDSRIMRKLQTAVYSFFTNHVKGKAYDNMWTTFDITRDKLKGNRYTKGFVSHNARATNDYRHKRNLAYLVNKHLHPGLVGYFNNKTVKVHEGLYAVSELIQWVFRSAIRDGQPVNLYIPSKRMRNLLITWIDGGIPAVQNC